MLAQGKTQRAGPGQINHDSEHGSLQFDKNQESDEGLKVANEQPSTQYLQTQDCRLDLTKSWKGALPLQTMFFSTLLGKSHYEVVCSMGFAKMNLKTIKATRVKYVNGQPQSKPYLTFLKASKEFYYHLGCALDNLARLIYIIRDPDSHNKMAAPTKPKKPGAKAKRRSWKQKELMRRYMAFGTSGLKAEIISEKKDIVAGTAAKPYKYTPYTIVNGREVQQVAYVRHFLTHVWSPPRKIDKATGEISWPVEIWTERVYVWPHAQLESKAHAKLTYKKAAEMMERDYKVIEKFQNAVFQKLTSHVPSFETNYGCSIAPISGGILDP